MVRRHMEKRIKNRQVNAAIAVLIILSLLTTAAAYAFGRDVYTYSRWLADNLEYINTVSYSDAPGRGESFAIRLTGPGDAYPVVTKSDTMYGTLTLSKTVKYAESLGMNVLAAVNSDFFSMQTGVPLGIVIENGVYKSSPSGRAAICFGHDGGVSFSEEPSVRISLFNEGAEAAESRNAVDEDEGGEASGSKGDGSSVTGDKTGGSEAPGSAAAGDGAPDNGAPGSEAPGNEAAGDGAPDYGAPGSEAPGNGAAGEEDAGNRGKTVRLINFNKYRTDTGGMYLFSECFSTVSTRTSSSGWFVVFEVLDGTPTVAGTMKLRVVEKLTSEGSIGIGEGRMILTAAYESGYSAEFEKFDVGDIVTLTTSCNDESVINARYATGSGDTLVSEGEVADFEGWDKALMQRAPRTAFGVREDGAVISYVIDGRNSQHSVGMTPEELADEMLRQGCVFAVNLDGGGSSALSVRTPGESEHTVVNKPSDGVERGCATYILFVTDAVSDSFAKNLSLVNDGVIVLAGSSLDIAFSATDSGYMPVDVPDDTFAVPTADDALVRGRRYTAGKSAGTDIIELFSPSTGASGTGSVFVITQPTSITVTRRGSASQLSSVRLMPGETLELGITATYYRRAVTAQPLSYSYTISGDIGEMVSPGVFKAGYSMFQTGVLTVSAGERKVDIKIEVSGFDDMLEHWAKEYVEHLLQESVTKGVSATEYGPSLPMRRADYILMLFRAAGEPEFDDCGNYDDVDGESYYATALAWAKAAGVTDMTEVNLFDPQQPLERQDAFLFTYRALSVLGIEYEDGTWDDLEGFPDADSIDDYAMIPAMTLVSLGVVEGMDGMISPHSTLTRAQMAKILAVTLQLEKVEHEGIEPGIES